MVEEIADVAQKLNAIGIEGVFVGGATLVLLVSDPASVPPRFTDDIDVVVAAGTRYQYERVAERLRSAGYVQPPGAHQICRWDIGGTMVDVMPPIEDVLGFANTWYNASLASAEHIIVNGVEVRVIDAPHLLATKLEAFFNRGVGDPLMSKDLTDIVVLLDGRPELVAEVGAADQVLRSYISRGMQRLLRLGFPELLPGHLPSDTSSQGRAPTILERARELAGSLE